MMPRIALLTLTLVSLTPAIGQCRPAQKDLPMTEGEAIQNTSTALMLGGIVIKLAEFINNGKQVTGLTQRETTLYTTMLILGKLCKGWLGMSDATALKGLLAAGLWKAMYNLDRPIGNVPGVHYLHTQDPTRHIMRVFLLLIAYDQSKKGIAWAARKLGIVR